jgi:hypothetical protein
LAKQTFREVRMMFLLSRRKEKLDVRSRNSLKKSQRDRLNEKHKRKLVKRTEEEMLKGKETSCMMTQKEGDKKCCKRKIQSYGANTERESFVHNYMLFTGGFNLSPCKRPEGMSFFAASRRPERMYLWARVVH